jgi:hypothetical protein
MMKAAIISCFFYICAVQLFGIINILGSCEAYGQLTSIKAVANYVYTTNSEDDFIIYNVSNPLAPTEAGECWVPGHSLKSINVNNNIALICNDEYGNYGLFIFDVTNPQNPQHVSTFETGEPANGIAVSGDFVYIANNTLGLKIINIEDPYNPQLVSTYDTGCARAIAIVGSTVYLTDTVVGLMIFDVTDPYNPILKSNCGSSGWADSVTLNDNLAFVLYQTKLMIFDVTNNQNPQVLSTYTANFGLASTISVSDDIAYIADLGGLHILNVNNPHNPYLIESDQNPSFCLDVANNIVYRGCDTTLNISCWSFENFTPFLGSCDTPGSASSIQVVNNLAYVSDGAAGLSIVDVSDSQNPFLLGNCNTFGSAVDVKVIGNIAYVADIDYGLKVIDVTNPQNPQLLGSCPLSGYAHSLVVSNNVAYVACEIACLNLINVANPQSPTSLGYFYQQSSDATSVAINNNILFLINSTYGLDIIDVSNPQSPQLLSNYITGSNPQSVAVRDNIVYLADNSQDIKILDVTNAANPTLAGTIHTNYTSGVLKVYVKDNYLIILNMVRNVLGIYDITNNLEPALLKDYVNNLSIWDFCLDNNRLYTAHGELGISIYDLNLLLPNDDHEIEPLNKLTLSNYPNPFNPTTTICFNLSKSGMVNLDIYNIRGQNVKSLLNERIIAGEHTISWSSTDDNGSAVASGVYFARISSEGKTSSRKLVLLK